MRCNGFDPGETGSSVSQLIHISTALILRLTDVNPGDCFVRIGFLLKRNSIPSMAEPKFMYIPVLAIVSNKPMVTPLNQLLWLINPESFRIIF